MLEVLTGPWNRLEANRSEDQILKKHYCLRKVCCLFQWYNNLQVLWLAQEEEGCKIQTVPKESMLPTAPSHVVKEDMRSRKTCKRIKNKNTAQRQTLRQRRTMERQLPPESNIRVHTRISPIIKVGVLQVLWLHNC